MVIRRDAWLLFSGDLLSYLAQEFMANAEVGSYLYVREPVVELRVLLDKVFVPLVCGLAQVVDHPALEGDMGFLGHDAKESFDARIGGISGVLVGFGNQQDFAVF